MWCIEKIQIRGGGYLAGVAISLPPGLTCIIGPRGSGKTTLAEAIRYALGDSGSGAKARAALIRDNLGSSTLVVEAAIKGGERYVVSRSHPLSPTVASPDGRPLVNVELERGTFLPIDAYSSREIEDIADESLGAKRRTLLDSLKPDQMRDIELSVNEARRGLEANADQVRAVRQLIVEIREQEEELAGATERLANMPEAQATEEGANLRRRPSSKT
jgi:DNA repair exonuclease SbcCD ATPase subunit